MISSQAKPAPAQDVGLELTLLCDALDLTERGAFLFAICEEGPLRERLVRHVREHLEAAGRDWIEAELSPEQPDLAGTLTSSPLCPSPSLPTLGEGAGGRGGAVVLVHTHGLAEPGDENVIRTLRALNLQRERLGRLNTPLVFWLSQNTLGQMVQHAADLFAARSGLFYLQASRREPGAPPPMRAEATMDLLDRFHRTLLPREELQRRAALYARRLEREQAAGSPNWPGIAFLCRDLANIYRELDDHEQAAGLQDRAIEAYQKAIAEQEQDARSAGGKKQEWAVLQGWLGNAYAQRIRGERADNLEQAIAAFQAALEVWTAEAFPRYHEIAARNLERALAAASPRTP
jgi:hypothetical protein